MVDARRIADVKALLQDFVEYTASPRMNNNELKDIALKLHRATGRLKDHVMTLPPEGRTVGFEAEVQVKSESHLGRVLQHIMEKRNGG